MCGVRQLSQHARFARTAQFTAAILRANAHLMTIGEPFLSGLAGNLDRYVVVYLISRSHEVEGLALINWVARVTTTDGQPMPPGTETTPRASMTYLRPVAERAAVVRWDCRWTT